MMIEAAMGDAYGAGFEFRELDFIIQHNQLTQYHPHELYTELFKRYTDDTQMAIAIAELILEDNNWNEIKVADKFVEVFHRDKRRGYSDRVYQALNNSKNGQDFLKNISFQSTGNGSAMRAYPIGYLKDIHQILYYCELQAMTSHNTMEGISAAKRIALAVHFYTYDLDKELPLIDFINDTLQENEKYEVSSPIDMHGYPTTKAVIKMVADAVSMQDCLKEVINYGGDTDTTAALCMAILSNKKTCEKSLPLFLFGELEDGAFGKQYIIELDHQLKIKFLN